MANGVKTFHPDYTAYSSKWERTRDVIEGEDEIYAKGIKYLPKLADETPDEYIARQQRASFYNATWRTVSAFVGLLFRKSPKLEVPAQLKELLNDVTMSGMDFEGFAKEVTLEDFAISRVGVLVDYPVRTVQDENLTVAEAEQLGKRPRMVMYKAETIRNWHHEYINGKTVLTQVRLTEKQVVQKTEFEFEETTLIRVLDLFNGVYRVRIFKEDNEEQVGPELYPLMNGQPLDFIPFYIIGPDGDNINLSSPIMIDLVNLNLKHFQVTADYEHGCHFTGLPTPYVSGAQQEFDGQGRPIDKKYYVGSTAVWLLPQGAEANYLEFSGQGLQALEKNLERKEAQMAAIGARMLTAEKAGVEAAETVAMRHSGENSILASIAISVSQGLQKALETFAAWANIKGELDFEINRDFMPFPITPQALTALLSAVQAGRLSHESFFDLLKRGDLLEADLNFETEQARIDSAPPPQAFMPPPVKPGANNNVGNKEEKDASQKAARQEEKA